MKRIDRYIFKTVVGTTLVAVLVILVLDALLGLLGELEDLGKGDYGLGRIFYFILLTLPRRIYELFPIALLLGGLMGMGALAAGSELVVMRGVGLSRWRLSFAALQAGLLLSLLILLMGEYIAPQAEQLARESRASAQSETMAIRAGRGFWARDGDHFINILAVLPGVRLTDIHLYEVDDQANLKSIAYAQGARYVNGRWVLDRIRRSVISADGVESEYLVGLVMNSVLNPKILELLAAKPRHLSMRQLLTYIDYLQNNGLDAEPYRLAFWRKALAPAAYLAMLWIAMPFVFVYQRKAGAGQRLMIGICLGLLYLLLGRMLSNIVLLYQYPPWLAAALPPLLFFGAGAYLLRRLR